MKKVCKKSGWLGVACAFLFLFFLGGLPGVRGQGANGRSLEIRVLTYHYTLSDQEKRDIELGVANIFTFYKYRYRLPMRTPFVVTIRIFGNASEFMVYKAGLGIPPALMGAPGFFVPKTGEIAVQKMASRGQMISLMLHEVHHRIFQENCKSGPAWLNEGLSEFFATTRASGTSAIIKPDARHEQMLRRMLTRKMLPSLKDHLNISLPQWQQGGIRNYTIGWGLASFLMSTPSGKEITAKLLYGIKSRRGAGFDSVTAIEKNYPGGLRHFERDWHDYIKKRKSSQSYPSDVRRRAKFTVTATTLESK